jgi:hypothetical protein
MRNAMLAGILLVAAFAAPARADQLYQLRGVDRYAVVGGHARYNVSLAGSQRLKIATVKGRMRFTVRAHYVRTANNNRDSVQAFFTQSMRPDGDLDDGTSYDPDYVTILNQPFAVWIDSDTRSGGDSARVPLTFDAPLTGGTLRGYLARAGVGIVAGRRAVSMRFDASGPMSGSDSDDPQRRIRGTVRMRGTAYYGARDGLLLALDETFSVSARLYEGSHSLPLQIVHRRFIKASKIPDEGTEREQALNGAHARDRTRRGTGRGPIVGRI